MEGLKRQLRYQIYDSKYSLTIFWVIVIIVNILSYLLNVYSTVLFNTSSSGEFSFTIGAVEGSKLSVAAGNIIPIAIFIIVYNMIMYYENFPAAIGFSSTRKDFYIGAAINSMLLCLALSIIEGILLKLDGPIIKALGREPLYEQMFLNTQKDSLLFIVAMLFIILIIFCSLFNLLGILSYRYGFKLWIGIVALVIIFSSNAMAFNRIFGKPLQFIFSYNHPLSFSIKMLILSFLLYAIGWLFARKVNIKSGK